MSCFVCCYGFSERKIFFPLFSYLLGSGFSPPVYTWSGHTLSPRVNRSRKSELCGLCPRREGTSPGKVLGREWLCVSTGGRVVCGKGKERKPCSPEPCSLLHLSSPWVRSEPAGRGLRWTCLKTQALPLALVSRVERG